MNNDFSKLQSAVRKLYMAAYWSPDRDCDAAKLWEDVRDAAGIVHGQSPKRIEPKQIPLLFVVFPSLGRWCGYY